MKNQINLAGVLLAIMLSSTTIIYGQTNTSNNGKAFDYSKAAIGQNYPNPFSKCTFIDVFVPVYMKSVQVKVFSLEGEEIKSIDVEMQATKSKVVNPEPPYTIQGEFFPGRVYICNDSLVAGTYNYSLIVDSNVVDTKQLTMIK